MTSLLILIFILAVLFVLHSLGILRNFSFSWDFVGRLWLYILLGFGILTLLVKTWSIVVILTHLPANLLISPSQNPAIDIFSTVILAIGLYGIWRWKKWGAYLVLLRLAFTIIVQVFVYHSLNWQLIADYTGKDNLFADVSGAITWVIAFSLTWGHFNNGYRSNRERTVEKG